MIDSSSFTDLCDFLDACIDISKSANARKPVTFIQLGQLAPPGLVCEFGVYTGRTINILAHVFPNRTIHGFDSFEGLPEDWRTGYPAGFFAHAIPQVKPNVELHVGWFENTVPKFASQVAGTPCSLIHIDCDLYSSTVTCFEHLETSFVRDTILIFDELWYPENYKDHEYRAASELIERLKQNKLSLTFLGNIHDESFAFKVSTST